MHSCITIAVQSTARVVTIVVGCLLSAGCAKDSDRALPDQRPSQGRESRSASGVTAPPSQATASSSSDAGHRRLLLFDQSVSMRGFASNGTLQNIEQELSKKFRIVGGADSNPWEFLAVKGSLAPAKPPLSNPEKLDGGSTNLVDAVSALSAPDVALGVLVTDGLPSSPDASTRPCYDLVLESVEPFARPFAAAAQAGMGSWMTLLQVPFDGTLYLNCGQMSRANAEQVRRAHRGRSLSACNPVAGGDCRCPGECSVNWKGPRTIVIFTLAKPSWIEPTRRALRSFEDGLAESGFSTQVSTIELFPGQPQTWRLAGDPPQLLQFDLASIQSPRAMPFAKAAESERTWRARGVCLPQQDGELGFEVCMERVPAPSGAFQTLMESGEPDVLLPEPGKDMRRSGSQVNILAGTHYLHWDSGWVLPKESSVLQTRAYGTCRHLLETVTARTGWHQHTKTDQGGQGWCRQFIAFCGCLLREDLLGPQASARILPTVAYRTRPNGRSAAGAVEDFSVEEEPYLHPDRVFGLSSFVRALQTSLTHLWPDGREDRLGTFVVDIEAKQ